MNFKDRKFVTAFWTWFDSQSKELRDKFNYYPNDMAYLFFYNKIYRYKEVNELRVLSTGT